MAPKDLKKLLEKYLAGDCTEQECDLIEAWYFKLGRNDASEVPENDRIVSAGAQILHKIEQHTRTASPDVARTNQRSLFSYYTAIAASLLIFAACGYYFLASEESADVIDQQITIPALTDTRNESGTRRRVILPDGSIVMMAPDSRIRYSNKTDTPSREIFLEGEAYFDVAHNVERPFYVYAGNVVTRVLGTSFVVRNRGQNEKITVSVRTGKVTVYSRKTSHKQVVLAPNQEAIYDQATDLVATQRVAPDRQIAKQGNFTEMHFEETPVSEVLDLLTKTYDIDIVFQEESLSGCVLTSSFYEEGLYDRIDVICTAIGATYSIVDAQIIIESKGCNLKPS